MRERAFLVDGLVDLPRLRIDVRDWYAWLGVMDNLADGIDECQRIAGGTQLEGHTLQALRILTIGNVDHRRNVALERAVSRGLGDTDNLDIGRFALTEAEAAADRILICEILLGEDLVDYRHSGQSCRIAFPNFAAQQNRNLHGLEEGRADFEDRGSWFTAGGAGMPGMITPV